MWWAGWLGIIVVSLGFGAWVDGHFRGGTAIMMFWYRQKPTRALWHGLFVGHWRVSKVKTEIRAWHEMNGANWRRNQR